MVALQFVVLYLFWAYKCVSGRYLVTLTRVLLFRQLHWLILALRFHIGV